MNKTIKGIEYVTFAPGKNAEELGIDLEREFIVVDDERYEGEGDILEYECYTIGLISFKRIKDGKTRLMHWSELAYYDEAPASKTKFEVGDTELIIHCTTKQQWKDVCEKLERDYPYLVGGYCGKPTNREYNNESPYMLVWCNKYNLDSCGIKFIELNYPQIPITTAQEYLGYHHNTTTPVTKFVFSTSTIPKFNNKLTNNKKPMSRIKKAFMSKESKAIEYYELGQNSKNLNSDGLNEFLEYLYETNKEAKTGFLKMLVDQHKEDVKS